MINKAVKWHIHKKNVFHTNNLQLLQDIDILSSEQVKRRQLNIFLLLYTCLGFVYLI